MESAPDDILVLIFEAYIYNLNQPPASLLTVCRRFNNLLIHSPTLWSRIDIHIRSINTIPNLLRDENTRIHTHLLRSVSPGTNVPLDISITWHQSSDIASDHHYTCGVSPLEVFNCPESPCRLYSTREQQLKALLRVLAEKSSIYEEQRDVTSGSLTRWRSLKLDLYGLHDSVLEQGITLMPLGEQGPRGYVKFPSLHRLILHNCVVDLQDFQAPKLHHLELDNAGLYAYPNMRSITSLVLKNAIKCRGLNLSRFQLPWDDCISLRRLEMWGATQPFNDFYHYNLPCLSTIVYDVNIPASLVENLGRIYNESRPLGTLVFLGMSVEAASYLLAMTKKLRMKKLKLRSWWWHRYLPASEIGDEIDDSIIDSWEVTFGDLNSGCHMLQDMQSRGTEVEALDPHMERIFSIIRKTWPNIFN